MSRKSSTANTKLDNRKNIMQFVSLLLNMGLEIVNKKFSCWVYNVIELKILSRFFSEIESQTVKSGQSRQKYIFLKFVLNNSEHGYSDKHRHFLSTNV